MPAIIGLNSIRWLQVQEITASGDLSPARSSKNVFLIGRSDLYMWKNYGSFLGCCCDWSWLCVRLQPVTRRITLVAARHERLVFTVPPVPQRTYAVISPMDKKAGRDHLVDVQAVENGEGCFWELVEIRTVWTESRSV